ncbi:MAG TPA: hypothetical protein VEO01_09685 [Pseudonocardiaceae bacterium]|nr:hypothetical protein [Pseudonocardiaceae bacterium]
MADYFRPTTAAALGRITGLDAVEPETLARWSRQMIAGFDNPTLDPDRTRTARQAAAEAAEAVRPLAERVTTTPDGSLLSHFTHSGCPATGKRAPQEILPTFVDMISTFTEPAIMAGSTLLALMQHPQQLHTVRTAPERMHDAVREAMRYWPVIGTLGRPARPSDRPPSRDARSTRATCWRWRSPRRIATRRYTPSRTP